MLTLNTRKHIKKLHQKKYREELGEFIVEGKKGVEQAIASGAKIKMIVVLKNVADDFRNIFGNFKNVIFCGKIDAQQIKTTETFPGVLAVVKKPQVDISDFNSGKIIALDSVADPGNVGTIIRTANWFGVKNILLSEKCVDLFNPKTVRATMGSIFHLNVVQSVNFLEDLEGLQSGGREVVAVDMNGEDFTKTKISDGAVLVLGSESHGLQKDVVTLAKKTISIKGNRHSGAEKSAESLNVAVAAGIILQKL